MPLTRAFSFLSLLVLFTSASLFPAHAWGADDTDTATVPGSPYESRITDTSYGYGIIAGYGFNVGDPWDLDFLVANPYVTVPLSRPMGGSFYRGVLEYKGELNLGVVVNQDDSAAVGLSPIGLRYNFTSPGGKLVPYVEGLVGGVYLDVPKYVQGTRFNFTETVGAGARYFVSEKSAIEVQARYHHISNAGMRKPNHGINAVMLLVGVSFY